VTRARSPWLVLAVAVVLPGVGQVLNGQPKRGLVLVFYMLLLGALTLLVADPDRSLAGRLAGGLFVYALSLLDAYRVAALRRATGRPASAMSPRSV
jgi:hypothetical protein